MLLVIMYIATLLIVLYDLQSRWKEDPQQAYVG